jgi:GTP-binding protein
VFVDEVEIHVAAGHGGAGALSFRREKFVPRGGPDGGNGGKGGSVYLVADPHRNTLVHFRFTSEFAAKRGGQGEGSLRTGRDGDDLVIPVPVGTTVYKHDPLIPESDELIADLTHVGERVRVAQGGRGGLGNAHFATSTNRAPRKHQPGEPGEEFHLRLKLKLLADVGLVGFPNAGKSTFIARVSAAKPKIADYPFTTLTPNLGVVTLSNERSFVVADVPGLIEGAHEGHGLGHQFLRHIERTKVLIHLVDVSGASGRDPVEDFDTLRNELTLYNRELLEKPHLVVANKIDALDEPDRVTRLADRARALALPFFRVSAVTGEGVPALLEAAWPHIAEAREAEAAAAALHDEEQPRRKHGPIEPAPEDRPGDGREADREAPPDDLPPDYNPALVPPVKGGGRGKGSRKR